MMILTSADIQKYVPLQTSSFSFDKYAGFETRALHKYMPRFLGSDLMNNIESETPNENLIEKITPVLANLAVLEATPFFDVVLTSSGFGVVKNNNIAPASRDRVHAFVNGCQTAANDFLDILLAFLEDNIQQEPFDSWNRCSLNPESLLPDTSTFNNQSRLNIKRHQFVDLKQNISSIELTIFAQTLSSEFLSELQNSNDIVIKPLFQKALAFMAYQDWLNDTDPEKSGSLWKNKGASFLSRGMSVLVANLDIYATYAAHGYEAPYDNADDENEDSGFFIAGATS
jgi:hypothetical protein